ncbi:hypothetical protein C343_03149 [Cryptococcus neoformans C23]|uniref:RING-type domain-containing protein n=1 Tax=Cryptococcus neoformans (strain H99 / ATCC 208821 / CBS 10515 / FGSC 9487) TaxID=235443 RepID=J9VR22_CRYN9|nr:hypothetical protein CNAG_01087 [Cryptococcus neoformans var. grubii H99]AUB24801.1 hypothetical protein CKF44_01087 [Cryptococcus neoformans var. grubii]OWZ32513.1 hypothetical protein C347_03212 [Cryptococcus neoformans var. grubii AD2-60a]OWZ44360.1 hypothetical protein C343_03149 [Cryptococcus neoformans var. grubii C23]OWZ57623.1 hypothetical protein C368_00789 [Cryptococcus neoformans var. grubii 125.91]OXC84829.1 hypothetical protein C344_02910 [Cryptococcus neoformans var. grubii AD|eukprot:XP_012049306.1 hypothetical protein CNAG_01087 [Cryptococcus neoformans var. grubii H99]
MSQMGSVSGWYTNAYSGSFRSSRLRAPSLLPNRQIPAPVQQTLVIDVAHNIHTGMDMQGENGKSKVKRRETVFGPDVGEDDEPGWTDGAKEEISVDVVRKWVEKTKADEGLHPTTTLQALVNLKRPTLLLQQIEQSEPAEETNKYDEITPVAYEHQKGEPEETNFAPPLHTLKFSYDATTPSVRISLLLYPTPQPPIEGKESILEDHEPRLLYDGLHPGGFGQVFELPKKFAIDLRSAIQVPAEEKEEEGDEGKKGALVAHGDQAEQVQQLDVGTQGQQDNQGRRRFGLFRSNRGDSGGLEESQIEMTNQGEGQKEGEVKEEKKPIEQGMRVLIRIDGVGPQGESLKRRNAQLTHILITGTWVSDPNGSENSQSGKRVWVVKVARREAVIGTHTFLLKEIFGLSQASSSPAYPPTSDDPYASTPNECIVCLTSPRDVVLLPCRHLVVCRECAVGMVEFGAGNRVARREEMDSAEIGQNGDAFIENGTGGGGSSGGNVPQVAGGTTATGRERRKKKVKGWYCPVCRQPYTSLLRLALPEPSDRPARPSSRASVRTTRTTKSLAPTLPDGAERMLESLRPQGGGDSDEDADAVDETQIHEPERPRFVLEEDKEEIEHHENLESSPNPAPMPTAAPVSTSASAPDGEHSVGEGPKGWKEVAT